MIFNLRNSMRFLSIMLIALYGCQTIQSDNMSKAIDDTASQETSDSIREQDQHQLSMSDDPINDMTSVLESAKKNASVTRKGVAPPNNVIESLLSPLISSKITAPHESKFDINVKNVDAQSLFLGLVKDTSYNMVVHPEVKGAISLNLQNVTVPEVLSVINDVYGYPIKRNGRMFQVLPAGIRTEVFKVNYLNIRRQGLSETRVSSGSVSAADSNNSSSNSSTNSVDDDQNNSSQQGRLVGTHIITSGRSDFWGELKQNLNVLIGEGDDRRVIVTPQSGMIIVRALPSEIKVVKEYLLAAELIMKRQVILEAKILEVTLNDDFQSGINWTAIGNPSAGKSVIASQGGATVANAGGQNLIAIPGATGIRSANTATGIFGLTLSLNDFTGIIDLLETQGTVQVLSSPRISTVNNQKAVIKVGTDEFFVTEVTNNVTSSASGPAVSSPSVELTPFFSGIALDVTPQIGVDDSIVLHVHPTVSEVVEQQRSFTVGDQPFELPLAQSSIRESDSIIYAQSDQVVVIGGLIQNVSKTSNAATPWASKIPIIGNAFKQKDQRSTKRELVILLRPRVFSDSVNAEVIKNSLERFSNFQSTIKNNY
ncbi:MAG: pilus (MSHA type) biogenesis protein MshL [Cellvibrionales bacterium]|jgi:MSHA biogenesis protein MshL|nr:pilus (MSHA type) biogenesis protein MshL [Cellvibrionales bacterium]